MKNKKVIIVILIFILVLIAGGGYYVLSNRSSSNTQTQQEAVSEVVPTINPSDIGLTLTLSDDEKSVDMKISNLKDLATIDYELTYTAKPSTGSTTDRVNRGMIGHIDIKSSDLVITKNIKLGTCSDVCHYDSEVKDIKITAKITKSDGKVYETEVKL